MKQGHHHRQGHRGLVPLLLLLLLTHGLLFFIARGRADSPNRSKAEAAPAAAKSRERGSGNGLGRGEDVAAGFSRRLRELVETPLAELSQEDFLTARRELFREWLRRDPRSALDMLYSPLEKERLESLRGELADELREVMKRQSREVASWLDARRYGSYTAKVQERWLYAVMNDGQSDLVMERLPLVSTAAMHDFVSELCYRANPAQLAQIRSFLGSEQAREASHYGDMLDSYVWRLVEIPGATAENLLAAESDPRLRELIATNWVNRELEHLPAVDAARGLSALPADARLAAIERMAGSERWGNVDGINLLEEMDAQQLLASLTPEHMEIVIDSMLGREDDTFGNYRPVVEMFIATAALSRPALRETVMEALGASSGTIEALMVLENLSKIPAGRERDAFLGALASHMSPADKSLPELIAAIGDRELAGKIQREREKAKGEDGESAE